MSKRGHGEGTLSKKQNGKWLAQISLGNQRLTKTLDSRKEALEWIRTISNQKTVGLTFEGTKTTVGELFESW